MGFLWWLLMGVTAGPALACTAVSLDRRVKYLNEEEAGMRRAATILVANGVVRPLHGAARVFTAMGDATEHMASRLSNLGDTLESVEKYVRGRFLVRLVKVKPGHHDHHRHHHHKHEPHGQPKVEGVTEVLAEASAPNAAAPSSVRHRASATATMAAVEEEEEDLDEF